MKLLYMNQGGGGDWGAIPYLSYNVLCLAECTVRKHGFSVLHECGLPKMMVQVDDNYSREVRGMSDLDKSLGSVRPIVRMQLTRDNVIVVFVHLKSGSEGRANDELQIAANALKTYLSDNLRQPNYPVLWVGDFNRAEFEVVHSVFRSAVPIVRGGGQAKWDLDWVFITGDWTTRPTAEIVSTSSDHGHIGIGVTVERQPLM